MHRLGQVNRKKERSMKTCLRALPARNSDIHLGINLFKRG